jgi:hypothetical protein
MHPPRERTVVRETEDAEDPVDIHKEHWKL